MTQPPNANQDPSPSGTFQAIRRLGDYHLLRKLGQGGMGEVYLAKRVGVGGFEKAVVIKCMLESLAGSEEFVAMFFDEAHLAARLVHPHIAQILDFGVVDQQYYIAMEYIAGEDIASIISQLLKEQMEVPVAVAVRVMMDVCSALDYAHGLTENGVPLGIVHRDVSPSNIMVSYLGEVKLLDFGIAKATARVSHTRAGGVKGKLSFLAPELIRGADVDVRADIFSLGITFYSLLTGEHPFRRDSEIATAHAISDGEAPDPRERRAALPADLVAIVMRALAHEPDQRFASAAEMRAALQGFLSQHGLPSGTSELAAFMLEVFGEDARRRKNDVPTLTRLNLAAVVNTPLTLPRAEVDREGRPTPKSVPLLGRAARLWPWLALAGAGVVVGGSIAAWQMRQAPAAEVRGELHPATVSSAPPAPPPPLPPAPPAKSEPVATKERAEERPVARASAPRARPAPARPSRTPLDGKVLQAVVARGQARFVACFKRHAAALPSETGQVKVELAVASSGEVSKASADLPGWQSPPLAACLETEALRLRFPAHPDREVRFAFPLVYRRSGR